LDLGLTLVYNSLSVWTVSGNYVAFDMDQGDPSPGFRLGFPTVQGPYSNNLAGANFYLLITPSGGHQELRQISTNVYQTVDASYSQLTYYDNGTPNTSADDYLIYRAGGAQLKFYLNPAGTEWHCTEVKDRNGNFLTIDYAGGDDIRTVTDTLGRVVTFNYDGYGCLQTITQPWNGTSHAWATFGWSNITLGNNFPSLSDAGWWPGMTTPVLTQVGLADGSYYTFAYNTYAQVSKVRYFGGDNRPLNYTAYDLPASSSDSPRVTAERVWADWWNGMNNVPAEVVTQYGHDQDGACKMTLPDGTIYKEYYGSGWQSGLTTGEEFWSGGVKKKWTATTWDQDNSSLGYPNNPRVIETNINDAENNRKRTRTDYAAYNLADGTTINLPQNSYEYQANAATVLRRAHVEYNTSTTYTSRRIIGLPTENTLYEVDPGTGNETLMSKVGFAYDESGSIQGTDAPAQHDNASFGASLVAGRGNLSSVKRYDVTNTAQSTTSSMQYNTSGSVVTSSDALGHQSTIEYSPSFAYAYPTKVKDPDWNSSTAPNNYSTVQYNFDTGAVMQTKGPPPAAGQTAGASQTMTYDSAGRLSRTDNLNNGAYVRWDYGSWVVTKSETIQDGAGESHTVTILNGFGGAVAMGGDNPGSAGGSWAKFMISDLMGRPSQFTNPTEINSAWVPSGDDAAGWLFSTPIVYDWKGRPLTTYNLDGTYKTAEYGGCGCAGGEVVTLTDEVGRRQRVTSDALGRQYKTEVLNWDGSV